VDLQEQTITADGFHADFEIDGYTRWRLLEGLDDIGLTLRHEEKIDAYEADRPSFKPRTLPVKVASAS
jgi:3-isopropylmalate/(R)-2-methylmalate dehydratase small subunit